MEKLTRKEAIEIVGLGAIEMVDSLNCGQTCRVLDNTEWVGYVEFRSTFDVNDTLSVSAYYYQDEDMVNAVGDLGELDWHVEFYEVNILKGLTN